MVEKIVDSFQARNEQLTEERLRESKQEDQLYDNYLRQTNEYIAKLKQCHEDEELVNKSRLLDEIRVENFVD